MSTMSSNITRTVGLLVCLQIVYSLGMIQLRDECPKVKVDPSLNETDCGYCVDCGYSIGSMCCPNECGSFSCAYVQNPCVVDGKEYRHHSWMPLPNNYEMDKCGDCFCQNGKKECYLYRCSGGARP